MSNGLGRLEWGKTMMAEALHHGVFDLLEREHGSGRVYSCVVTDYKSVFDHIKNPGSKTLEDQRASLDILVIKDSLLRTSTQRRWCPTKLQCADALTKDGALPADGLRAMLRTGRYAIAPEEEVMARAAQERARRLAIGAARRETANAQGKLWSGRRTLSPIPENSD